MDIKTYTAEEIAALTPEALAALHTETVTAFDAALALDAPTKDEVAAASTHASNRDLIEARQAELAAEDEAAAKEFEALKTRKFGADKAETEGEGTESAANEDEESEGNEAEDPDEGEEESGDEGEGDAEAQAAAKKTAAKSTTAKGGVKALAKARKPAQEAPQRPVFDPVVITASAEAPNAASGHIDLTQVAEMALEYAGRFSAPSGDGKTEEIRRFGTAKFAIQFPDELMVESMEDSEKAEAAIKVATDESRLPGGSLVAAAGWCAPSETVYDLDQDATTEGMLSLPEIGVRRGGIRFPVRPEFATFYASPGFKKTEAEVAAGSAKTCITIPCPSFTDVRLDVDGVCIKVDILHEVGYPENVANYVSGTLIAHEHWINADVIGRVVTAAGTARVITGLGESATDLLEGLILVIDQRRQIHRLSFNHTMEVLLPFWVKNMLKATLARRTGRPAVAVQDSEITAIFAAAGANVQWLYDWQDLTVADEVYPATFQAVVYPAGTFVKGTSPVISLDTVYDAASLATNTYTGLFTEQAYLVAKKKLGADLLTFPIRNSGRTGAADIDAEPAA